MSGCHGYATPDLYRSATILRAALDSGVLSRHFLPSASNNEPPNARIMLTRYSLPVVSLRPGRMPYTVVRPPSLLVKPLARVVISSKVQLPSAGGIFSPSFCTSDVLT